MPPKRATSKSSLVASDVSDFERFDRHLVSRSALYECTDPSQVFTDTGFALPPVLESRCSPRETWPRLEDYVSQVTDGKGSFEIVHRWIVPQLPLSSGFDLMDSTEVEETGENRTISEAERRSYARKLADYRRLLGMSCSSEYPSWLQWLYSILFAISTSSESSSWIPSGDYLWELIYPKLSEFSLPEDPDASFSENVSSSSSSSAGIPSISPRGMYVVRLFFNSCWRQVLVDDRVPLDADGNSLLPVLVSGKHCSSDSFEVWPFLLCKAILKASAGSVGVLYSDAGHVLELLTGHSMQWVLLPPLSLDSPVKTEDKMLSLSISNIKEREAILSDAFGIFFSSPESTRTTPVIFLSCRNICLMPEEDQLVEEFCVRYGIPHSELLSILDVRRVDNVGILVRCMAPSLSWCGNYSYDDSRVWTASFEEKLGFCRQDRIFSPRSYCDAWIPLSEIAKFARSIIIRKVDKDVDFESEKMHKDVQTESKTYALSELMKKLQSSSESGSSLAVAIRIKRSCAEDVRNSEEEPIDAQQDRRLSSGENFFRFRLQISVVNEAHIPFSEKPIDTEFSMDKCTSLIVYHFDFQSSMSIDKQASALGYRTVEISLPLSFALDSTNSCRTEQIEERIFPFEIIFPYGVSTTSSQFVLSWSAFAADCRFEVDMQVDTLTTCLQEFLSSPLYYKSIRVPLFGSTAEAKAAKGALPSIQYPRIGSVGLASDTMNLPQLWSRVCFSAPEGTILGMQVTLSQNLDPGRDSLTLGSSLSDEEMSFLSSGMIFRGGIQASTLSETQRIVDSRSQQPSSSSESSSQDHNLVASTQLIFSGSSLPLSPLSSPLNSYYVDLLSYCSEELWLSFGNTGTLTIPVDLAVIFRILSSSPTPLDSFASTKFTNSTVEENWYCPNQSFILFSNVVTTNSPAPLIAFIQTHPSDIQLRVRLRIPAASDPKDKKKNPSSGSSGIDLGEVYDLGVFSSGFAQVYIPSLQTDKKGPSRCVLEAILESEHPSLLPDAPMPPEDLSLHSDRNYLSYRLRICSPVPGVTVQPDSTRKEYYESIKSTWAAEKGRSDAAKSARSAFIENLSSVENGIDQVQLDVVSSGDSRLLTAEVIEDTIAKLQQELEVANNRHEQFLKNREGLVQELEEISSKLATSSHEDREAWIQKISDILANDRENYRKSHIPPQAPVDDKKKKKK